MVSRQQGRRPSQRCGRFRRPDRRAFVFRTAIPALSWRSSAAKRLHYQLRQRRPGLQIRSPLNRPRPGLPGATYRQAPLRLYRVARRPSAKQAVQESYMYRCRCPVYHTQRARCHRRGAQSWLRRRIARRSMRLRPFPSRALSHRASSSPPRACALTSRTFPRQARGIRDNVATKMECLSPHRSSAR